MNLKIIVTLTSYKDRITNVKNVILSILNNTKIPDKIVLNLSSDEFKNKEKDLPNDLINLITKNNIIELFWVKENTFQFKKLLPTLKRYPNDIIISIDDDFIYNNNFIKSLYNDFIKYDCKYPITCWKNTATGISIYGNLNTHMGAASLTMYKFYGEYVYDIYENLVKNKLKNKVHIFDDTMYTYSAYLNGSQYKLSSMLFNDLIKQEIETNTRISNNWSDLKKWHKDIKDYIEQKYGKVFVKDIGFIDSNNNHNITFIIVNRGGQHVDTVIKNFENTFKNQFKYIKFIVIELCDDELFLRGQLYNIAFKYVNTEYMALIDNDIYNLDTFNIIDTYVQLGGPYVAFDEISLIKFNDANYSNYSILVSEKRYAGFGAFSIMKRADFEKINGFSNLCFGWGAEDNILHEKIKFKRMIHTLGHINHPRRVNLNPDSTTNNRKILSLYRNGKIDQLSDGAKLTTYNIVYDSCKDNVRYIGVNNISVTNNYIYMNEYINAAKIARKKDIDIKAQEKPNNTKAQKNKIFKLQNKKCKTHKEKLIVSLTTWKKRINNIPIVLTTILSQTKKPDKIVLNLSSEEFKNKEKEFSDKINKFLDENKDMIIINWVDGPNTKLWKKIIPTFKLFPNDCIVNIDDDFIYPNDMLETFWNMHILHPHNPLSGNKVNLFGCQCHCGCASLTKLEYFDNIFDYINDNDLFNMYSSDIFYTYVANKSNHPYIYCGKLFYTNMHSYNDTYALSSNNDSTVNAIFDTWNYLVSKYGKLQQLVIKKTITPKKTTIINHSSYDDYDNYGY